jgi:predicted acetyltransferase
MEFSTLSSTIDLVKITMNQYIIEDIASSDRLQLNHLIQQFLAEQSEFSGATPNQQGYFECQHLLHQRYAYYVVFEGNQLIGFATKTENAGTHDLVACFIAKEHRRQGLGTRLVGHVFSCYPGDWQVKQLEEDQAAQSFFRKALAGFQSGFFEEQLIGDPCDGLVNQQTFFVADCQ